MASSFVAISANLPAPPKAVPEILDYPNFKRVDVPVGSKAVRAWKGVVRPFLDDSSARCFLRAIEGGKPVDVCEGTIDASAPQLTEHWADQWLVATGLRFLLLVLEFGEPEHPRAYSLQPEISRQMQPLHPHLRTDKPMIFRGRPIPALCVYSGAEFRYSNTSPKIVQFLDQATVFIARHIIWLRTRIEIPKRLGSRFRVPLPGEAIFDHLRLVQNDPNFSLIRRRVPLLTGYWPGPEAACGAARHVGTISRSRECWCCSGRKYGECHRDADIRHMRQRESPM
jgi:hypothetical protein